MRLEFEQVSNRALYDPWPPAAFVTLTIAVDNIFFDGKLATRVINCEAPDVSSHAWWLVAAAVTGVFVDSA